jgi:hypothetical protein
MRFNNQFNNEMHILLSLSLLLLINLTNLVKATHAQLSLPEKKALATLV